MDKLTVASTTAGLVLIGVFAWSVDPRGLLLAAGLVLVVVGLFVDVP
jgi:hypothetical protein